jgi:osmotically-inducible protein OsmY
VINSEYGVITLRGEVDTPEQIRELEAAAARIPGVRGVQTMLHLPNTPPPNKAESIRAS